MNDVCRSCNYEGNEWWCPTVGGPYGSCLTGDSVFCQSHAFATWNAANADRCGSRVCSQHSSCSSCLNQFYGECGWCPSQQQCIYIGFTATDPTPETTCEYTARDGPLVTYGLCNVLPCTQYRSCAACTSAGGSDVCVWCGETGECLYGDRTGGSAFYAVSPLRESCKSGFVTNGGTCSTSDEEDGDTFPDDFTTPKNAVDFPNATASTDAAASVRYQYHSPAIPVAPLSAHEVSQTAAPSNAQARSNGDDPVAPSKASLKDVDCSTFSDCVSCANSQSPSCAWCPALSLCRSDRNGPAVPTCPALTDVGELVTDSSLCSPPCSIALTCAQCVALKNTLGTQQAECTWCHTTQKCIWTSEWHSGEDLNSMYMKPCPYSLEANFAARSASDCAILPWSTLTNCQDCVSTSSSNGAGHGWCNIVGACLAFQSTCSDTDWVGSGDVDKCNGLAPPPSAPSDGKTCQSALTTSLSPGKIVLLQPHAGVVRAPPPCNSNGTATVLQGSWFQIVSQISGVYRVRLCSAIEYAVPIRVSALLAENCGSITCKFGESWLLSPTVSPPICSSLPTMSQLEQVLQVPAQVGQNIFLFIETADSTAPLLLGIGLEIACATVGSWKEDCTDCLPGWAGIHCTTPCPLCDVSSAGCDDGVHGSGVCRCTTACNGHGVCNQQDGLCICNNAVGSWSLTCDDCDKAHFGPDCNKTCNSCLNDAICSSGLGGDGMCLCAQSCLDHGVCDRERGDCNCTASGWHGDRCDLDGIHQGQLVAVALGVALAVWLGLCCFVVLRFAPVHDLEPKYTQQGYRLNFANVWAVLMMILEVLQLLYFSFPNIVPWGPWADSARSALLVAVLHFVNVTLLIREALSLGVVILVALFVVPFLWLVPADDGRGSYTQLAITAKTQNRKLNPPQTVLLPASRGTLARSCGRLMIPLPIIVGVLLVLNIPLVKVFLQGLQCTYSLPGSPPLLDDVPSVQCWTSAHTPYLALTVCGLLLTPPLWLKFVPLVTSLQEFAENKDIFFRWQFLFVMMVVKLVCCAAEVVLSTYALAYALAILLSQSALLVANIRLRPCRNRVNVWNNVSFAICSWAAACATAEVALVTSGSEASLVPAVFLGGGVFGILMLGVGYEIGWLKPWKQVVRLMECAVHRRKEWGNVVVATDHGSSMNGDHEEDGTFFDMSDDSQEQEVRA